MRGTPISREQFMYPMSSKISPLHVWETLVKLRHSLSTTLLLLGSISAILIIVMWVVLLCIKAWHRESLVFPLRLLIKRACMQLWHWLLLWRSFIKPLHLFWLESNLCCHPGLSVPPTYDCVASPLNWPCNQDCLHCSPKGWFGCWRALSKYLS